MSEPAPVLELRSVSSGYERLEVVHSVSLTVREGQICALVGANGAGKSTLLKTISGLLRPSSGTIASRGVELNGLTPEEIVRHGVAHVAEGRRIFREQTVADNLELGMYSIQGSRAELAERRDEVFELFPVLAERLRSDAGALSGGQQQMLAIAQALVRRPTLLLLDEPSLGLAPVVVDQMLDVLERIRQAGNSILLVEQMVERALELADYGYVLQTGTVVGQGQPAELTEGDLLRRAYLGSSVEQVETGGSFKHAEP